MQISMTPKSSLGLMTDSKWVSTAEANDTWSQACAEIPSSHLIDVVDDWMIRQLNQNWTMRCYESRGLCMDVDEHRTAIHVSINWSYHLSICDSVEKSDRQNVTDAWGCHLPTPTQTGTWSRTGWLHHGNTRHERCFLQQTPYSSIIEMQVSGPWGR